MNRTFTDDGCWSAKNIKPQEWNNSLCAAATHKQPEWLWIALPSVSDEVLEVSLFLSSSTSFLWGGHCILVNYVFNEEGCDHDSSASSVNAALSHYAGNIYLESVGSSRQKIAKLGNPFIRDGTVSEAICMHHAIHTCTHKHTRTHTHTCTHTQAHTHTRAHTHTHVDSMNGRHFNPRSFVNCYQIWLTMAAVVETSCFSLNEVAELLAVSSCLNPITCSYKPRPNRYEFLLLAPTSDGGVFVSVFRLFWLTPNLELFWSCCKKHSTRARE